MPVFKTSLPPSQQPINPNQNTTTPTNVGATYLYEDFTDELVTSINGTSWDCTYYGQYLGSSDVVINNDDVTDPTLKSYLKLNKFELKVTQALELSYDAATGVSTLSGVANVYPVMTPLVGDRFIANIQLGQYGIFEVTNVTPKSHFKQTTWEIQYSLVVYKTPEAVAALDSCVVNNLYFSLDKLSKERKPFLTEYEVNVEYNKFDKARALYSYFFTEFYNSRLDTFLVPEEVENVYDYFILDFIVKVIDKRITGLFPNPLLIDIRDAFYTSPYITIYDVIIQQSEALLFNCVKVLDKARVSGLNSPLISNSLLALGIYSFVYPLQMEGTIFRNTFVNVTDNSTIPPTIVPVDYPTYIFSKEFYTDLTPMDLLEVQIVKLIKKQTIAFKDISPLMDSILLEDKVKQFYRIPFLLLLGQMARE